MIFVASLSAKSPVPLPATATAARFEKAPVIDGKAGGDEWKRAAWIPGFLAAGKGGRRWLDPRWGMTRIGFTAERLYFAVQTELPPDGELIAQQTRRDAVKIVFDSAIEIWISDLSRKGVQYQFMGNSTGACCDAKKSAGSPDTGWKADWEYANRLDREKSLWTAEVSVPLADVGGPEGNPVGRTVKVLVARDFKRPWSQATAVPSAGHFVSSEYYLRLRLTENDPVVHLLTPGEYGRGEFGPLYEKGLNLRMEVVNPGPARSVRVGCAAGHSDLPKVDKSEKLPLPAGGSADFRFRTPAGRFHVNAAHWAHLHVNDPQEKTPLFDYGFEWTKTGQQWSKVREKPWNVVTGPKPEAALQVAYYPSRDFLRVRLDPRELADLDAGSDRASIVLRDGDGEKLLENSVRWDSLPAVRRFDVPALKEGTYELSAKLNRYEKVLTDQFERRRFAWEGNRLGITRKVHAPFEPVEVQGRGVRVVLRRYRMGGLGLWESVEARGQGENAPLRELLAGPMRLVANGDQELKGEGRFTRREDHEVVYEAEASHAGVTAQVRSTLEYDGCMKVELTLKPGSGQEELRSLSLRVPLKDKFAPLYHVSTTGLRINPAGTTPGGTGTVWDSYDFSTGEWHDNFHPYIWLGGPSRGLCWFADNDRGWVVEAGKKGGGAPTPPQELIRRDGVLTLRVNLVQRPVRIEEPRKIVFGLMATPAKPMPENWRRYGRPEHSIDFSMGYVFGLPAIFSAKYPLDHDFSTFNKQQELRLTKPVLTRTEFIRSRCRPVSPLPGSGPRPSACRPATSPPPSPSARVREPPRRTRGFPGWRCWSTRSTRASVPAAIRSR
jgi:hypothetical protein